MNYPHSRSTRRKSIFLVAILCLSAAQAWAHAKLDHSEPSVDGVAKQPPTEVRLTFSEKVEANFCHVQVLDASGQEIDRKDMHADPKNASALVVSLPAALAAGTYKVVWRAVAADTHVTKGEFTFRVQP